MKVDERRKTVQQDLREHQLLELPKVQCAAGRFRKTK